MGSMSHTLDASLFFFLDADINDENASDMLASQRLCLPHPPSCVLSSWPRRPKSESPPLTHHYPSFRIYPISLSSGSAPPPFLPSATNVPRQRMDATTKKSGADASNHEEAPTVTAAMAQAVDTAKKEGARLATNMPATEILPSAGMAALLDQGPLVTKSSSGGGDGGISSTASPTSRRSSRAARTARKRARIDQNGTYQPVSSPSSSQAAAAMAKDLSDMGVSQTINDDELEAVRTSRLSPHLFSSSTPSPPPLPAILKSLFSNACVLTSASLTPPCPPSAAQ